MQSQVSIAVFPVAGLGTRILPATKASPKEMLPVVDKPLIQYATEEAVAAGVTTLVFVTGRSKRAIEDHFDRDPSLEAALAARGQEALLEAVQSVVPPHVTCLYVRQAEPLGLGHAVLCARAAVGERPFFVILPDDLIVGDGPGCCTQLADVHRQTGGSVVAVQHVADEDVARYGIVATADEAADPLRIVGIVEKPSLATAPSRLGAIGRYLFTPRIFDSLARTGTGTGGELQLTDGIAALLGSEPVYGLRYAGERFDCGNKLRYLQAVVQQGRRHQDIGPAFDSWLKTLK